MRLRSWGLAAVAGIAVVVVAVVAVLVARATQTSSGPAAAPSSPAATGQDQVAAPLAPTVVHHVAPVDAHGRLAAGYRVAASGRGRCFSTSLVDDRLYRCFQGNTILDPCWPQPGRAVACLPQPWSHAVTRLRLTAALPPRQHFGRHLWALQLGAGLGVRCTAAMGATGIVAGQRISYLGARGWALLGEPDRRRPTWTIATARGADGQYSARGRKPLAAAWLARVS
ncbi:MAG TPA: hypothetical protein VI452_12865 [Marmoricola sp.]